MKIGKKWRKVARSGEKWGKLEKVWKSDEKWLNVVKSGEKLGKSWEKLGKFGKNV